jgi:hypothetical protein
VESGGRVLFLLLRVMYLVPQSNLIYPLVDPNDNIRLLLMISIAWHVLATESSRDQQPFLYTVV